MRGPRIFCLLPLFVILFDLNIMLLLQVCVRCRWWSWTTKECVIFFDEYFLSFGYFDVDFLAFWFSRIFIICCHQVTWPTLAARWTWPKNIPISVLFPNWCPLDMSFALIRMYSTKAPKCVKFMDISFLECCLAISHIIMHVARIAPARRCTVPPFFSVKVSCGWREFNVWQCLLFGICNYWWRSFPCCIPSIS